MAGLYCWIEGWDFGTSLYFQYITYLTIGFGDVVPGKEEVGLQPRPQGHLRSQDGRWREEDPGEEQVT